MENGGLTALFDAAGGTFETGVKAIVIGNAILNIFL